MKETKQKKEGAWMTPNDIVLKMINFIDDDFYKTNVLEPTAGEGAIVLEILNKKLNIGMTPQEAINTTFANEFDEGRYNTMVKNINDWCIEHGCNIEINNIRLGDAVNIDFDDWIGNEQGYNVITNLPFGSWENSNLPKQIINNLSNHHAVYLTKWSTGCCKKYVPHVKKFENVVFPGIAYDTLLWEYDTAYTEGDIWIYWPIPKFPKHKLKKEYTKAGQTDEEIL